MRRKGEINVRVTNARGFAQARTSIRIRRHAENHYKKRDPIIRRQASGVSMSAYDFALSLSLWAHACVCVCVCLFYLRALIQVRIQ